jgi:transposase-like protein
MLSIKQVNFIKAYLKGGEVNKACESAGISKTTFYNWINEEGEFKKKFQEIKKQVEKDLIEGFNSLIPDVFNVLKSELNNQNAYIRLKAVQLILDSFYKFKSFDLEERLEKIEEAINEGYKKEA